jgi:hypothetical protein
VVKDLNVSFPKPCSESWDTMRPLGCNRFCDRCKKTIHDLSQLTVHEVEELASSGEICVRAEVGPGGSVRVKQAGRATRRMLATVGASVAILAVSAPATAAERVKLGAIKGAIIGSCGGGAVIATATDGRIYRTKIGMNGRYKVKRLPAGSYEVKVETGAEYHPEGGIDRAGVPGLPPTSAHVAVQPGRTSGQDLSTPNMCIIVGMLKIEHSSS